MTNNTPDAAQQPPADSADSAATFDLLWLDKLEQDYRIACNELTEMVRAQNGDTREALRRADVAAENLANYISTRYAVIRAALRPHVGLVVGGRAVVIHSDETKWWTVNVSNGGIIEGDTLTIKKLDGDAVFAVNSRGDTVFIPLRYLRPLSDGDSGETGGGV